MTLPARPRWNLRSEADRQIPATLSRLRLQGHLHVCTRHDGARDPRRPRKTRWHRRIARPDLGCRRRRGGSRPSGRTGRWTVYSLVFFDAIGAKIRDEGFIRNKAVYIALGIMPDGTKEILGIWIEQTEGAEFWLRVMNELKSRAVPRRRRSSRPPASRSSRCGIPQCRVVIEGAAMKTN